MQRKKKSGMKYKNGVWTTQSASDMNDFFYHTEDQRTLAEQPLLEYAPDHTDLIWDRKFQVCVPTIAVKSVETLSRMGLVITGIKLIDEKAHERLVYPFISINDIITIEDNGYDVNYIGYPTLISIYECVKEYLEFWTDLNREFNKDVHSFTNYPVDDISRIESYLHSIYPLIEKSVQKPETSWASVMGRFMLTSITSTTEPRVREISVEAPVNNQGLSENTLGEV